MIAGDYTEKNRKTKSGKTVTDKVVKSTTGVEYAIGKKFDSGGVGSVFRALRLSDKKACVFKEYVPSPGTRRVHNAIKQNIQNLMQKPLTEEDGVTPLRSFVGPMDKDSLIELPASRGFGYIMKLVDTKVFLPIVKLRHSIYTYPDADILCKSCINIAHLFKRIHFRGWCYKDINEENIYINNKTGDVRVIDCDNISVQSVRTVNGTPNGYMAPEVYITRTPDRFTDYFSLAVLFYRLFVGGYPLDGKRTREYLINNNLSIMEASATIYGTMALFAFDPKDKSNEIRGLTDPLDPFLYEYQTKLWERLPTEIQRGFIQTFSAGLKFDDNYKRTSDSKWIRIFENLQTTGLIRCHCGRMNFGDTKKPVKCIFCNAILPQIKLLPSPTLKTVKKAIPKIIPKSVVAVNELTTVEFKARRDIAPTHLNITVKRKQQLPGNDVYPGLNEGWMRIEYSRRLNMLSTVNLSRHTWTISENGVNTTCAPGERVIIKKGLVITVMYRKLQLTVTEIK